MNQSRRLFVLLILILDIPCFAKPLTFPFCAPNFQYETDKKIKEVYTQSQQKTLSSISSRIKYFSQTFLDYPYTWTALGEGPRAHFDQAPLYRVDTYDCQTYVETVLALALSDSLKQFKRCIAKIRYANGSIAYTKRHHFLSPDWNTYNQQQGFIEDITRTIVDQDHQPVAVYAKTQIDPPQWYQHFNASKIRLCHASEKTVQKTLKKLQQKGRTLQTKTDILPYIPLTALFDANNKPNMHVFNQIPDGAIIELVRPNWDLTKAIGTHLNVSHLGFAIREQGILYFYQASSIVQKVDKPTLVDYLLNVKSSPTIRGINIQKVLPSKLCQNALRSELKS
ncbi:MAG: hypothetical protein CK424_00050 [Legionella sp.]|nr:MAG: hypothetical protein CK424_00050 [Legionella sp.]